MGDFVGISLSQLLENPNTNYLCYFYHSVVALNS